MNSREPRQAYFGLSDRAEIRRKGRKPRRPATRATAGRGPRCRPRGGGWVATRGRRAAGPRRAPRRAAVCTWAGRARDPPQPLGSARTRRKESLSSSAIVRGAITAPLPPRKDPLPEKRPSRPREGRFQLGCAPWTNRFGDGARHAAFCPDWLGQSIAATTEKGFRSTTRRRDGVARTARSTTFTIPTSGPRPCCRRA